MVLIEILSFVLGHYSKESLQVCTYNILFIRWIQLLYHVVGTRGLRRFVRFHLDYYNPLVRGCLIWYFEQYSFIPPHKSRDDPTLNKLYPSKTALEFIGNAAYGIENDVFQQRRKYWDLPLRYYIDYESVMYFIYI